LTAAAQYHANDLPLLNTLTHIGRDGSTFTDRAVRSGFEIVNGVELIAGGYGNVDTLLYAWFNPSGTSPSAA
jgi:uncharacterized protein YkwD